MEANEDENLPMSTRGELRRAKLEAELERGVAADDDRSMTAG
jgi:hypothetical protein